MSARILIAGFGSVGRSHFRNLRSLGVQEFVFFRSHRGALEDIETAGWPSTTDLDEALAMKPTVAVVSNPTALHVAVALKVAKSGCDLFVEKPLSHTREGSQELLDVVDDRELVAMVGYQFRFHPLLRSLKEQVDAGRLGAVVSARAEWGEYLPAWHPWEDYRESYSARKDLGGGVILTLSHTLDYLYWMFGPVADIQASVRKIDALKTEVDDDVAAIMLNFETGVLASVHLDYVQRPPKHRLSVLGEDGCAKLDFHAGKLDWVEPDGATDQEVVPAAFERNTLFNDEMRHFLAAVAQRTAPLIPLREGYAVMDIALLAMESAQENVRGRTAAHAN
ncbi:MAG: Gfo/Idh/MocA family oxidoreductase [Rhodothermales bacterium]